MIALAIHGGAGLSSKKQFSDEEFASYRKSLSQIVSSSYGLLKSGSSALEVVVEAVRLLEDDPLFNAGKGSVLDSEGQVSMDACVMCGGSLKVGGVTDFQKIRNPVLGAQWILENSPHTVVSGRFLEEKLEKEGFQCENSEYFLVEKRYQQYLKLKGTAGIQLDHQGMKSESDTVGAVALDQNGNLAASSSSGGLTGKFPGRVSDSSIVGMGAYANNETCAVSATGTGDTFIQMSYCYDVHAQIKYAKTPLKQACMSSLDEVKRLGGIGGAIALDRSGNIVMEHNSLGMFCARQKQGESPVVQIFGPEK